MKMTDTDCDVHSPYTLSDEAIAAYARDGVVKLKNVFSAEELAMYEPHITKLVRERQAQEALEERDTYGQAFLQICNLWRMDDDACEFAFSKRLARIAAELMQVDGVRLYHDQALYKEVSGGFTPWHADQHYWPLATDKTITAWIPLQEVTQEMGPLEFALGSHKQDLGREQAISDESEYAIRDKVNAGGYEVNSTPFDLGEVSFHSGWCFHRAGPNTTGTERKVMTVIYMDQDMTLKTPEHDRQKGDWEKWVPGVEVGAVCDSPLNPILWNRWG